jgi:thiamine biosynthesis lipoprotein
MIDAPKRANIVHHEEHVMGTVVTIDIYRGDFDDHSLLESSIEAAIAILHDADQHFSTWKSESPLSRIRRGDLDVDDAPAIIGEVLQQCVVARTFSEGWFDPWAMPGGVDPTGLVKGWAAQRALEALRHDTIDGAIINAAGDIASFGGPTANRRFRVGIANPANPRSLACIVESPGAVATSGSYERGQHLFDPRQGLFSTRVASGTVVGPELGMADALATALVIGGAEVLDILERMDNFEGLIIDDDGTLLGTTGFPIIQ